jgi:hypothetical protein
MAQFFPLYSAKKRYKLHSKYKHVGTIKNNTNFRQITGVQKKLDTILNRMPVIDYPG